MKFGVRYEEYHLRALFNNKYDKLPLVIMAIPWGRGLKKRFINQHGKIQYLVLENFVANCYEKVA
jgi:hypothetical protein